MDPSKEDRAGSGPRPPGLANRLRHALGFRQTFAVGGVRYREVSAEPLRHALSRKGAGHKEYDVVFRDGSAMRIRATAKRVFADLSEPRLLPVYRRCEPLLLPGMRVLIVAGGTGYPGAWAAERVAPSGAVVLVDRDAEAIAYAQKRYAAANISFEVGGVEAISGETDGSFNAVFAVDALPEGDGAAAPDELWRVVAPGGWLMAAQAGDSPQILAALTRLGATEDAKPAALGDGKDGWTGAVLKKPAPERGPAGRDHPESG